MTHPRVQLIAHHDGHVDRLFSCDCGTKLYKKDLTNNTIEFLAHEQKGVRRYQVVQPSGNPSVLTLACPDCGMKHIAGNITENMGVADDTAISEEVIR